MKTLRARVPVPGIVLPEESAMLDWIEESVMRVRVELGVP